MMKLLSRFFANSRFERRVPWVPLVALVLSAVVFAVSLYHFQALAEEGARYEEVVVAKRPIPQHTLISEEDLAVQKVRPGSVHPDVIRDPSQAVGKVALSTIYEGEHLHVKRLGADLSDRQEVTIAVDMTRSGGVSAGDLVDVYFLRDETPWTGARAPVAVDAVVVAVLDAQGNELSQEGLLQSPDGVPAAVKLSLKPGEVPWVVRGALPDNCEYVLVRKLRPGGTAVPPEEGVDADDVSAAEGE
jgi:Flp pilus assembly protein CpaB